MRRADRLFQLIQILRRQPTAVTAEAIAAELEVSVRTVYRDVRDLQARRVPIDGAAGVGYVLREGYDLPPLMFTEDELEALLIGVRIVRSWADPGLAAAAGDVLGKVAAVLPEALRVRISSLSLLAPPSGRREPVAIDVAALRLAIRREHKVELDYVNAAGSATRRAVWPMSLAFFPPVWLLLAWCELRQDFRSFRLDRIGALRFPGERYPRVPGRRLVDWLRREGARV
jgi:predicted DNA-binding transcriptional regulator YafY